MFTLQKWFGVLLSCGPIISSLPSKILLYLQLRPSQWDDSLRSNPADRWCQLNSSGPRICALILECHCCPAKPPAQRFLSEETTTEKPFSWNKQRGLHSVWKKKGAESRRRHWRPELSRCWFSEPSNSMKAEKKTSCYQQKWQTAPERSQCVKHFTFFQNELF